MSDILKFLNNISNSAAKASVPKPVADLTKKVLALIDDSLKKTPVIQLSTLVKAIATLEESGWRCLPNNNRNGVDGTAIVDVKGQVVGLHSIIRQSDLHSLTVTKRVHNGKLRRTDDVLLSRDEATIAKLRAEYQMMIAMNS
jgi:hypothetical protein